jgi:hypothetical protein
MRIGRRPLFFLAIAIVFLVMLVPTPTEFRWLNIAMAGLSLFWFVLLAAEELAGARGGEEEDRAATRMPGGVAVDHPLTPPPSPRLRGGRQ